MSRVLALILCVSSAWAFQPTAKSTFARNTKLGIVADDTSVVDKVAKVLENVPELDEEFDETLKSYFPDALTNKELYTRVANVVAAKGMNGANTLLATSLCCDELARKLENDLCQFFGKNFNLGGLSGFPFAGNTGFGAMSAHIPDDGYCLLVYGPHVGVARDGTVGKVERNGIELIDTCCGSAVAASNYLQSISDGTKEIDINIKQFTDFQQQIVRELILPHGQRLSNADNRMVELPYALYESQDLLMQEIVQAGCAGVKKGIVLLGGIQINTGPTTPDYFHPLRFEMMNNGGEVVSNLLPSVSRKMITLEKISGELDSLMSDSSGKTQDQIKSLSSQMSELVNVMMNDA